MTRKIQECGEDVMKLTEKQKRFADYYIETGNAEESARKAGYKSPRGNAHKLLQNTSISQYINEQIEKKDSERIAKQDEILMFLTSVLRGEVTETIPLGLGYGEQRLAKKELDGKDRIKAAELLGKRYAMWTEKQEVNGNVGVTFIDDIGDEDEA